ncbi:alanine dehydrogenase [Demequina sp.]|uniref:alanine dehydrogenase n=1 Tax=Demequina sp. TaxID=2050685 RepID=UPI003A8628EF
MRIGVPKELKNRETRVALTPAGAKALAAAGHEVVVERGAGAGAFLPDREYVDAGAIIGTARQAWDADLVLKVKEPEPQEFGLLRDQTLFTFLHLAANPELAHALVAAGTTAISYDTVQLDDGSLPLLIPMSVIAGRLSIVEGAHFLLSACGGRGVLLGGAPGVAGARVVVIGGGVAGASALAQAIALGADAVVADIGDARLVRLAATHAGRVRTVPSRPEVIAQEVARADLVIGAVLVPGAQAPKVVTRAMAEAMRPGSVLVDIAIDQGGCFEFSRPTSHDDPVFRVGDSLVYCVANMPGAVGATATAALTAATGPYVAALAAGVKQAIAADAALARGVNVAAGTVTHPAVRAALASR